MGTWNNDYHYAVDDNGDNVDAQKLLSFGFVICVALPRFASYTLIEQYSILFSFQIFEGLRSEWKAAMMK